LRIVQAGVVAQGIMQAFVAVTERGQQFLSVCGRKVLMIDMAETLQHGDGGVFRVHVGQRSQPGA